MRALVAALAFLAAAPAAAHRLDEYLQQTTFAVEKDRIRGQIVLVPGVAVFPAVVSRIDTDGNGAVSETEQRAYARQVLHDVSLKLDGDRLAPRLAGVSFDGTDLLREGRGSIRIDFDAEVRSRATGRRLTFENRHRSAIAVYLVNALVPGDPDIRLGAQDRSFDQSSYALEYVDAGAPLPARSLQPWLWLCAGIVVLLVLVGRVATRRVPPTAPRLP